MPYINERASRLGHVPVVNNEAVQKALRGWSVSAARPNDSGTIQRLCMPLGQLPGQEGAPDDVRFSITVDGSDTEVEAVRQHPSVKVGYLRIAGSVVDLDKFRHLGQEKYVDPRKFREAHSNYSFDAALPGSGLVRQGMNGRDTWRVELNRFLLDSRLDAKSEITLADGLLAVNGKSGTPASTLPLRVCPSCDYKQDGGSAPILVSKTGGSCPQCRCDLYLADTLRLHEEYKPEGSNFTPVTRAMNMAERLMTACYMRYFSTTKPQALRHTLFITDGPLALHGPIAPQSRQFVQFQQHLMSELAASGIAGPLLVGVEKSGVFVEHAEQIRELIPKGNVMMLTNEYINSITGRPAGHRYGVDEFYGRRFVYRASNGDALVITVSPKPGVAPYSDSQNAEAFDSYPHLRLVCEVLDSLRTRMYHNAVIPVALAHSAASLPLGVGQSVLTMMAQQNIPGLKTNHQTARASHWNK